MNPFGNMRPPHGSYDPYQSSNGNAPYGSSPHGNDAHYGLSPHGHDPYGSSTSQYGSTPNYGFSSDYDTSTSADYSTSTSANYSTPTYAGTSTYL